MVRIGLLGTLEVHDEAGRPVRVGGYRVRMLLTLLALDAGQVVPTHSLIDRLWEDEPPANASNSLQSLVSRLRTSLRQAGLDNDVIESHPAGYRLAVSPHDVDAVAFERLAREGSQALANGDAVTARRALHEALRAWRGPALADAAGAQFAAGPAVRLEELRTRAALDLIDAGLALGETDSVIGELRAMIAADPVAERPRGLLMRALYGAGRQAEALGVFTDTRELLASELGVDPSPWLEHIHLGVLRQDLPGGSGGPPSDGRTASDAAEPSPEAGGPVSRDHRRPLLTGVRKPLTSFVGRDADVARVLKMLEEGRLVTLTGPGGAGKTRLAIETAMRLAEVSLAGVADAAPASGQAEAAEGSQVWLTELTPTTDPDEVPSAVLHAVGIRDSLVIGRAGPGQPGVPADPADRVVAALADRSGLLVLDNCEHVVAAAAQLADKILAGCPGVRVLVTSREPLRIPGEALWPVPPLPVPPVPEPAPALPTRDGASQGEPACDIAGDQIAGYASVRLLADRAAAVLPDFTVDTANAADVARICRALDGMPLAIELAAARLRTLSAGQLAQRLDARFELLTGGSRTAVPRHQTLRAVVDWSWELLSQAEQVLAMRLATFTGGATLTAAEQVCQDGALPAQSVLPAIFGLVEKSFLIVEPNGEPRYRMLETIRAYCLERLKESGEEVRARQAFAQHFLHLAEAADPLLRGADQSIWMRRLTADYDNIQAALRWAVARRDAVLALRFGQALGWFWLLRGHCHENGAMARDILAVSAPADLAGQADGDLDAVQARAICALIAVNASWDITEVKQPLMDAEILLTEAPAAGEAAVLMERTPHPLVIIGVAMLGLYEKRDPERAIRVLAAYFRSADPWIRSGALLMHAFFSVNLGRMDGVADRCAEALAGFEAIGDQWGVAMALLGKAELALLDGNYAQAIAALEHAVELSSELTNWEDIAQMHAGLAKSRGRMGDLAGALADLAQAERVSRAQGHSESELWIAYIRAELAWLRGDLAEVSGICQRLDDQVATRPAAMGGSFRALILLRGGLANLRTGHDAEGHSALATALRLAVEGQDRSVVAAVMEGLAATVLRTGDDRALAERAAALLGAAHAVRGTFDHSSLDSPGARDDARRALGGDLFEAAYQRGRELSYAQALTFADGIAQLTLRS